MKSKKVLFLIILFLTFIKTQAQPSSPHIFSPFNVCELSYLPIDNIVYGEIESIERFEEPIYLKYYRANKEPAKFKAVVNVLESFKGNLPHKIDIYIYYDFIVNTPAPKNRYIFKTINMLKDDAPVQFTAEISKPLTNYSKGAVKDVLNHIRSVVSGERQDFVEGYLLKTLNQTREMSIKGEKADRLIYNVNTNIPIPNIPIEFVSQKNGEVYRVNTKSDGSFRINKIQSGDYRVKLKVEGLKLQEPFVYSTDGTACTRKWFIFMTP